MLTVRFAVVPSILAATFAMVVACGDPDRPATSSGSSGSSGPASSSGSGGSSGSAEGGAEGGADGGGLGCQPSGSVGDTIPELTLVGTPPDPLGGTIAPGSYVLSELTAYAATSPVDGGGGSGAGLSGYSARSMVVIEGDTIKITGARGPSAAPLPADSTTALNFTIAGKALETTSVCPTTGVKKTIPYSAVGGGLALFTETGRREVYTKR